MGGAQGTLYGLWGPKELTDPEGSGAPPSTADRLSQPKACWDTRVAGVAHGCHTGLVTAEGLRPRL